MTEIEKVLKLDEILDNYIHIYDFLTDMQGSDKSLILRTSDNDSCLGVVNSPATLEIDSQHRLFEAIQTVITQEMYSKREELMKMAKDFHPDKEDTCSQ